MRLSRPLLIWGLFCLMAGMVFLAYAFASLAAGRGEFVLPLDDVYIHFQYARQMANGQPYVYNPGQPATSGATSFLYPFVLAAGYLLGFQGLNLALWAMIVGVLALLGSLWLVYKITAAFNAPDWLAVMTALIFGLTGAINWHFMSGMETGLMILFMLATLYAVVTDQFRGFIFSASLLALTRPEGGVLAIIAVGTMLLETAFSDTPLRNKRNLWLLIPILTIFVQPFVNMLVTGSAVATGNAAKSLFGMIPFYWDVVLGRIVENFARMWAEFATGVSPREGLYLPWGVGLLAFVALMVSLIRRDRWQISLMVILWLLAGTAAIATLDTAFWHFKRYQMPLMALFFPLAGWTIYLALAWVGAHRRAPLRLGIYILAGTGLLVALSTSTAFLHHFALNVNYVYLQPLQMARWLRENTPEDALIAVHDVGMMRYMGGRNTLDMVGLTTPGAAAYWRNGPGSIAEFLIQERPDYIAAYGEGHGLGLGMIAQTRIYGNPLAEFPVVLDDHFNVALANDYQGIYAKWYRLANPASVQVFPKPYEIVMSAVDSINVAEGDSEQAHEYHFRSHEDFLGFATEVHDSNTEGCQQVQCFVVDGGRQIDLEEAFKVFTYPAKDTILITRLMPQDTPGEIEVYINDQLVSHRWIPAIPGKWLEIATFIPAELVTDDLLVRIQPDSREALYAPYYHWAYQGNFPEAQPPDNPAALYQAGAFILTNPAIEQGKTDLNLKLDWYTDGSAEGDYRFFVHLYDDIDQPPIAQHDEYPGNGTLPPGNWLPGILRDAIVVDLSDVAPGTYQLAIGFYNPYTGERLMPESEVYEVSPDGRLWLGEVEVPAAN